MNNKPETVITSSGKTVKIIPATKSLHPEKDGVTPIYQKKRVAAYCRVSTTQEEQQGSFKLQKEYFERVIMNNPDWELVKIYGDEGKSGTSIKGRTGFLEMMDDVRAGKIDYIIAKATSRFGRNNAEFIKILDELEYYGIEVYFESEGILTSGSQTRMMLQMLGAANEHLSSTLSNNVRWSKERNMREGKVNICYGNFLGYKKGADGEPEIVPEEAKTVRLIFSLFLSGMSYTSIATHLNDLGLVTKKDKPWMGEGIRRIITNEKYTGDVLLQKTYKKSYLDKRCYKNTGERPQVLVKDNHEAIIDRETFAKAKELIEERSIRKTRGTAKSPFVGKVFCAECGEMFGHKTWNSRGRIKYSAWVCRSKYTEETTYGGKKCKTPNLREEWLVSGYLYAINELLAQKGEYLARYERKLARLERKLDPKKLEQAIRAEDQKIREIESSRIAFEREWEFTYGKSSEYDTRQNVFKAEMIKALSRKKELEEEQDNLRARKAELERFIETIEKLPNSLTKFNGPVFLKTIDHITVRPASLVYHFYGDEHISIPLEEVR